MTRIETLVLVHEKEKILLAMKKRRFGAGRYNGFGGGVEEGEKIKEGALRETKEESGLIPKNLNYIGKILFKFLDTDEQDHEVHFYEVTSYEGEPVETEEMKPVWFDKNSIPYDEMWPDDKYWMPLFLAGKKFKGEFHFKGKGEGISFYDLNEVQNIE